MASVEFIPHSRELHVHREPGVADLPDGTVIVFLGRNAEIVADAFDGSEIFFVCPFGGTVLDYLRQHGCPVYVTFYH